MLPGIRLGDVAVTTRQNVSNSITTGMMGVTGLPRATALGTVLALSRKDVSHALYPRRKKRKKRDIYGRGYSGDFSNLGF